MHNWERYIIHRPSSIVHAYTPHGTPSPLGVASGETGQLNVALSGATEESALSEDGKEGASIFPNFHWLGIVVNSFNFDYFERSDNFRKLSNMTNIERITEMEQRFDRVDEALQALEIAVDTITKLEDDILKLDAYYSSDEWKADFKSDELGLLPQDLKRGVLSEDAIWDLLGRVDAVKHRMLDFVMTDIPN